MPLSPSDRSFLILLAASAVVTTAVIASRVYKSRTCRSSTPRDEPTHAKEKHDPYDARPRSDYLSWDDYFMAVAFLSAQRSKDPNKQVGACIVGTDQIILGIGYNGFPRGCPDKSLPWAKLSRGGNKLETKYPYVVHAEANSILNAKNTHTLVGAKMYVTMFPCNECAKLIIQAGVKEVIFFEDKNKKAKGSPTKGGIKPEEAYQASRRLLSMAGVTLRHHQPQLPLILPGKQLAGGAADPTHAAAL